MDRRTDTQKFGGYNIIPRHFLWRGIKNVSSLLFSAKYIGVFVYNIFVNNYDSSTDPVIIKQLTHVISNKPNFVVPHWDLLVKAVLRKDRITERPSHRFNREIT